MRKLVMYLLCFSVTMGIVRPAAYAATASDFTDIGGHWAYESIAYVVETGLFAGTASTTFSPEQEMNRGMFVTVLGRYYESIFGKFDEANDAFGDTSPNSYYSKYVRWATDAGIISGYGNNLFGPDDPLTREQSAKILYAFSEYLYFDLSGQRASALSGYADESEISDWARDEMTWAVNMSIMNGVTSSTLAPQMNITRAQVAVILERYTTIYAIDADLSNRSAVTQSDYHAPLTVSEQYPYYCYAVDNTKGGELSGTLAVRNVNGESNNVTLHSFAISPGDIYYTSGSIDELSKYNSGDLLLTVVSASYIMEVPIVAICAAQPFRS